MSNDRDQAIVQSAISDTGSGLLEFLSALGQREAIAFGDGVSLPVRIRFDEMPKEFLPRSTGAAFTKQWQHSENDEMFLENLVERWRSAGLGAPIDPSLQAQQISEAMSAPGDDGYASASALTSPVRVGLGANAADPRQPIASGPARRDINSPLPNTAIPQRRPVPITPPAPAAPSSGGARSLRERLMTRS